MNRPNDQARGYRPVVIIGAGRSGTNVLRDVLTSFPGVGTWPCDEINYIWRHGNARFPTDEFTPEMARAEVIGYIRSRFKRLARRYNLAHVVEKTCANSLRVGFVHAVLPEAKFIHIVRDGRDVAVSAAERWKAPLDILYTLRKTRYVPLTDFPYYAGGYVLNRVCRLFSKEKRVAFWGPRFEGMENVLTSRPLPVACAIQWKRCAEKAEQDLSTLGPDQVYQVRYEDFVRAPARELRGLLDFLCIQAGDSLVRSAVTGVSSNSVGRWRAVLTGEMHDHVEKAIGHTLRKLGYDLS